MPQNKGHFVHSKQFYNEVEKVNLTDQAFQ